METMEPTRDINTAAKNDHGLSGRQNNKRQENTHISVQRYTIEDIVLKKKIDENDDDEQQQGKQIWITPRE